MKYLLTFVSAMAISPLASSVTIQAVDTGFYRDSFSNQHYSAPADHDPDNINYLVGVNGREYRNFAVFDLAGVSNITTATLRMFLKDDSITSRNGYSSPDSFETYTLWDVGTNVASLLGGTSPQSTFDDLGSGTMFGSVDVSASDNGTYVEVVLNADAITSMINSTGLWAIGGAVSTADSISEYLFAQSHEFPCVELVVNASSGSGSCAYNAPTPNPPPPVPLPMSAYFFGTALLGLFGLRRL